MHPSVHVTAKWNALHALQNTSSPCKWNTHDIKTDITFIKTIMQRTRLGTWAAESKR